MIFSIEDFYHRILEREKDGRLNKESALGIFGIDKKTNPAKLKDMKEQDIRRVFENTCRVHCEFSYFYFNIHFLLSCFLLQPPW